MLRLRFPSSTVTAALASCALAGFLFLGASMPTPAGAAADVAGLYTDALISGDAKALERLLAPNFIFIAPNGHIEDGSHFLESIRSRHFVVSDMTLKNMRETRTGDVRLITGNGTFMARSDNPLPGGLMRLTMVTDRSSGSEKILLVQVTPVIPTRDCRDGNCRIR